MLKTLQLNCLLNTSVAINNIRYADDTIILYDTIKGLQKLIDKNHPKGSIRPRHQVAETYRKPKG